MSGAQIFGGFDIGTRNSAAAFLDAKARLKHLSFIGGGVHTSNLPFVRTALQMYDATVKRLHDAGLTYCSLANARVRLARRVCVPRPVLLGRSGGQSPRRGGLPLASTPSTQQQQQKRHDARAVVRIPGRDRGRLPIRAALWRHDGAPDGGRGRLEV